MAWTEKPFQFGIYQIKLQANVWPLALGIPRYVLTLKDTKKFRGKNGDGNLSYNSSLC